MGRRTLVLGNLTSMLHRVLAVLGFASARVDVALRPLTRRLGDELSATWLVVVLLLIGAAIPTYAEASRVGPQTVSVDQIANGSLSGLVSWVRIRGRVVTLRDERATVAGYAVTSVLISSGQAIMLSSSQPIAGRTSITGQATLAAGSGHLIQSLAPPGVLDGVRVSPSGLVQVDDVSQPESTVNWVPVWLALIAALCLAIGWKTGYPVFADLHRRRGARSLRSGESVPVGVEVELRRSGRITALDQGQARLERDPHSDHQLALWLPGAESGVALRHDMWTAVHVGTLYTIARAIPALQVRSFAMYGSITFNRSDDRDRAAAVLLDD